MFATKTKHTTAQKSVFSKSLKKMNFIQQGHIKLIKRTGKDYHFYIVTKYFHFKCCSFESSIHQRIQKKMISVSLNIKLHKCFQH